LFSSISHGFKIAFSIEIIIFKDCVKWECLGNATSVAEWVTRNQAVQIKGRTTIVRKHVVFAMNKGMRSIKVQFESFG